MGLEVNLDRLMGFERDDLGTLVAAGSRRFSIPSNQRPWAWKKKQLKELWADIERTRRNYYEVGDGGILKQRQEPLGFPHFFGAFVFESERGNWSVVDGQQRLTAVSMVASALRERVAKLQIQREHGKKLAKLHGLLSEWVDGSSDAKEFIPRLELDESLADVFVGYIVGADTQEERDDWEESSGIDWKVSRSERHLKESFDFMRDLVLKQEFDSVEAEFEWANATNTVLREAFFCVHLEIKKEAFSYAVFDTLNARGTPLSEPDKTKNELFMKTPSSEHQRVKKLWDEIAKTVPGGDMEMFLRYWHIAFEGPCPKKNMSGFVSEVIESFGALPLLERWKEDAAWLQRVTLASAYAPLPVSSKPLLESVNTLGITYTWPFLMRAARELLPNSPEAFTSAVMLARNFAFRVLTIGGQDVGFLENHLGVAARSLSGPGDLKAVADKLKKANTDDDFRKSFSKKVEKRSKIQFYILRELELKLGGNRGVVPADQGANYANNVEHVLPKTLPKGKKRGAEWSGWRDAKGGASEDHRNYVNRLGNLILLEDDINKDVSNYEFLAKRTGKYPGTAGTVNSAKRQKRKRRSYKDSQMHMANELAESTKKKWREKDINDRQEEMAKVAVGTWTLDYP